MWISVRLGDLMAALTPPFYQHPVGGVQVQFFSLLSNQRTTRLSLSLPLS